MGLGDHYELYRTDWEENEDFFTFGREIVALADGKVVYARNDVPDTQRPEWSHHPFLTRGCPTRNARLPATPPSSITATESSARSRT